MEKNKQKKVEYHQINKLSLFKDLDGTNYATLKWSVRNGYPRVTVFTDKNVMLPDGKLDYSKVITAPFDVITLNSVLVTFMGIVKGEEKKMITVNCFNAKYENNAKTNDIVLQGKFVIGKDDKGINYMAVTEEGKPKIKFDLLPDPKWFTFLGDNGDVCNNKGISDAYAMGYIDLLTYALDYVVKTDITTNAVEAKAFDKVNKVAPPPPTNPTIEVSDDLDF